MSYIREVPLDATNYPPFAALVSALGFLPNFYRSQTLRPDLIEAEIQLIEAILVKDGALTRQDKEYIFLVCSASNMSTYCVTAHCEIARMLKLAGPEPERIAVDHTATNLPMATKALLNFAVKLNNEPAAIGQADVGALRTFGYNEEQILETVLTVGIAKFTNFVSLGLGTVPDFDSARVELRPKEAADEARAIL
jgi:uncharacterized peroxidase-related enzyme